MCCSMQITADCSWALTDSANEGDSSFTRDLLDGATDPDLDTLSVSVASVTYTMDGGSASGAAPGA